MAALALVEPVHGLIDFILVHVFDLEFRPKTAGGFLLVQCGGGGPLALG